MYVHNYKFLYMEINFNLRRIYFRSQIEFLNNLKKIFAWFRVTEILMLKRRTFKFFWKPQQSNAICHLFPYNIKYIVNFYANDFFNILIFFLTSKHKIKYLLTLHKFLRHTKFCLKSICYHILTFLLCWFNFSVFIFSLYMQQQSFPH